METTLRDLTSGADVLETLQYRGTTLYHFRRAANFSSAVVLDWWGFMTDDMALACSSEDSARALRKIKARWNIYRKESRG